MSNLSNSLTKKRDRILEDEENGLVFFDYQRKKNDICKNNSFKGNKLLLLKGSLLSWKNLFTNTSFMKDEEYESLNDFVNKEVYFGIIISKRTTNLPIRYSNMPGSVLSKVCSNSLYSVSENFPCSPLNANFEKINGERIIIENNSYSREKSIIEEVLFNIADDLNEFNDMDTVRRKKRKKEIKSNIDFLEKNLSIFPGNVGREYVVFQKYDEGIILDKDAIMDATPEILAQHIARRLRGCTILDACSGVGGNTIAFSQHCKYVVSVEISASRFMINKHNSQIYNLYGPNISFKKKVKNIEVNEINYIENNTFHSVSCDIKHTISYEDGLDMYFDPESNIIFVNGDILKFCDWYLKNKNKKKKKILGDLSKEMFFATRAFKEFDFFEWAFASPPWGGYSYNSYKKFNLDSSNYINYKDLIIKLSLIADNVALFLPRNTDVVEFVGFLSKLGFYAIEIESIRDTRYNYILGIILYCIRTRTKFNIEYLFGQTLENIGEQITYNLVNFVIEKKLYFMSKGCKNYEEIENDTSKNKLFDNFRMAISKIGTKIGSKLRKKGLEILVVLTYLLNYISYMDEKYTRLISYSSSTFIPQNGELKKSSLKYRRLIIKYSKYIKLMINEIENAYQSSFSE